MNWWILRKRIHSSWLIAIVSAGIVLGVMSAQYIGNGWANSIVCLVISLGLTIVGLWRSKTYVIPVLFAAGILLGLWRGSLVQAELSPYDSLIGHIVTVAGTVTEDPDTGKSGEVVLRLNQLRVDDRTLPGTIWAAATSRLDIKRGDVVALNGKLQDGFGSFVASMYRAKILKAQRPEPGDVAGRIRDWFASGVRHAVDEPAASLGIGYLVGQRRSLPPELDEALRVAGLMHIVVASGYNLTILVRLARRLFVKVSKYLAALSAGSMIVAFILVTGMSPSMSRAGLVAGLSLLAWYYGRKFHPLVLLPFAAAVTLLGNPSFAWGDLGWQLSFTAFAGVMVVAPLAQRYFYGEKKPGTVRQIIGETIAAQLCTLPILILAFGQFSNVAVIANLLILPFVPLAMLLTFIAGVGALLLPSLAGLVGAPAQWLLTYMISVAEQAAHVPWAQTNVTINGYIAAVLYGVLIVACLYIWRKTRFNLRQSNIVE